MRLYAHRLMGALFSLWFALYLGAPQAVHPCPAHSAPASAVVDEHAPHHGAHGNSTGQEQDRQAGGCCCPGPQCGASASVANAATYEAPETRIAADDTTPRDDTLTLLTRPARLLPPATAPPAPVA